MKTICNGKINNNGMCTKCYGMSQSTSAYCQRLIEVQPAKENIFRIDPLAQKLSSIIHEVIWQYCYGGGNTDSLFSYQDIDKAADEIVELFFQPESELAQLKTEVEKEPTITEAFPDTSKGAKQYNCKEAEKEVTANSFECSCPRCNKIHKNYEDAQKCCY